MTRTALLWTAAAVVPVVWGAVSWWLLARLWPVDPQPSSKPPTVPPPRFPSDFQI